MNFTPMLNSHGPVPVGGWGPMLYTVAPQAGPLAQNCVGPGKCQITSPALVWNGCALQQTVNIK